MLRGADAAVIHFWMAQGEDSSAFILSYSTGPESHRSISSDSARTLKLTCGPARSLLTLTGYFAPVEDTGTTNQLV